LKEREGGQKRMGREKRREKRDEWKKNGGEGEEREPRMTKMIYPSHR